MNWAAHPMPNYDAWLEAPYQRAQAEQPDDCPECGCELEVDRRYEEEWCACCDYSNGRDWDAEAERREERY